MYVAIGVNVQGRKELLGLWLGETEGAKFWLSCLTDLKERGVEDMFIVCVDGLSGFPEAIRAAFPQTKVQLCIVHLVRAALKYTTETDSREVAADLKTIYQSATDGVPISDRDPAPPDDSITVDDLFLSTNPPVVVETFARALARVQRNGGTVPVIEVFTD